MKNEIEAMITDITTTTSVSYTHLSNFYKLCYVSYLMEYSCLKTLARKHKCTIAKVVEKFKDHYGEWGIPYETKTDVYKRQGHCR